MSPISAGELLRRTFGRTDGLDRLLAGEELDARIMKGLAEIASERTTERVFDWLDAMNRFQIKALRSDLIERLEQRDQAAAARREDQAPDPNRQVIDRRPMRIVVQPGGALTEIFEGDDERQAQREASLANQRQHELEDRADDAARMAEHEAAQEVEMRKLAPPGIPV